MMPLDIKQVDKGRCFIVHSKDLFDKAKNPHLSLSVKDILANPRVSKWEIKTKEGKQNA